MFFSCCSELIQKYQENDHKLKESLSEVAALRHCIEGLKTEVQTLHQVRREGEGGREERGRGWEGEGERERVGRRRECEDGEGERRMECEDGGREGEGGEREGRSLEDVGRKRGLKRRGEGTLGGGMV